MNGLIYTVTYSTTKAFFGFVLSNEAYILLLMTVAYFIPSQLYKSINGSVFNILPQDDFWCLYGVVSV